MNKETSVLIVDDNVMTADVVKSVIESAGATVMSCNNSLRAIEMIKTCEYDVLITDYYMPDINGSEIVKMARLKSPKTFIVGISIEQRREQEFFSAGADTFLLKPFALSELINLIKGRCNF